MTKLVRIDGGSDGMIGWGLGGDGLGPSVFGRDIELLALDIAGTRFHGAIEFIDDLEVGQFLELRREPDNKHDGWAIGVRTVEQVMLGYVPREKNEVLARLMDAGKLLVARIDEIRRSTAHEKTGYDPGPGIRVMVIFRDV